MYKNGCNTDIVGYLKVGDIFMKADESENLNLYIVTDIESKIKNTVTCVCLYNGKKENIQELELAIPLNIDVDITITLK